MAGVDPGEAQSSASAWEREVAASFADPAHTMPPFTSAGFIGSLKLLLEVGTPEDVLDRVQYARKRADRAVAGDANFQVLRGLFAAAFVLWRIDDEPVADADIGRFVELQPRSKGASKSTRTFRQALAARRYRLVTQDPRESTSVDLRRGDIVLGGTRKFREQTRDAFIALVYTISDGDDIRAYWDAREDALVTPARADGGHSTSTDQVPTSPPLDERFPSETPVPQGLTSAHDATSEDVMAETPQLTEPSPDLIEVPTTVEREEPLAEPERSLSSGADDGRKQSERRTKNSAQEESVWPGRHDSTIVVPKVPLTGLHPAPGVAPSAQRHEEVPPKSLAADHARTRVAKLRMRRWIPVLAAFISLIVAVAWFIPRSANDAGGAVPPPSAAVPDTVAAIPGWGPSRPTISAGSSSSVMTLNSMIDNPTYGDERNFARVKAAADDNQSFVDQLLVRPGGVYEAIAYFLNDASEDHPEAVAEGVRMRALLPPVIRGSGRADVLMSGANVTPTTVWDGFTLLLADPSDQAAIRYVENSAVIHTNSSLDGSPVSVEALKGPDGVMLGCDQLDGRVEPGPRCSGYVTFQFRVDEPNFEVTASARRAGDETPYEGSVSANVGDTLQVLLEYRNTGTSQQDNVSMRVNGLPSELVYVNGSSRIANSTTGGEFKAASDGVTTVGYNLGSYRPGGNATFMFEVVVAGSPNGGDTRWVVAEPFARITTNSGFKEAPLTLLILSDPPRAESRSGDGSDYWEAHAGPQRATFTVSDGGSPYPSFNSLRDNPNIGDERNFVGLRPETTRAVPNVWTDDIWADIGDVVIARAYVHNSGVASISPSTSDSLQQARIRLGVTARPGEASIFAELSAVNAMTVWDGATIHVEEGAEVVIDPTSVKLENNAHPGPEGIDLGRDILGEGQQLGYAALDGNIPPGFNYASYVTMRLLVQQEQN